MKAKTHLISILLVLLCAACSAGPDLEPIDIARVDKAMAEYAMLTPEKQTELVDSLRPEIDAFMAFVGYPDPMPQELDAWSRSKVVEMFQPEIDRCYPNLHALESATAHILLAAKEDSLDFPPLRFAAVAWGKPQPIVRVDTVMLIALNHYLGADFAGYSHLEPYRRTEKAPEMIPYDLAAALAATQHPFEMAENPTLLNWMLYEGALVEAKMRMVPNARLCLALGYTPDQLELVEDNTQQIWEEMAVQKMIYDTDPALINRLLASAPNTPFLKGRAPGRIGRYIGYKIVREYVHKHPGASLEYLLSPDFYANSNTLFLSGF